MAELTVLYRFALKPNECEPKEEHQPREYGGQWEQEQ